MTTHFAFDNSYARLPDRFYARLDPTPVAAPAMLRLNRPLAGEMGLDVDALDGAEGARLFAGNGVPDGAAPLAQAYAGHQFGNFVPQLGDGRAILLGEVVGPDGRRRDVQLKGAGRTPWSRMGDGRSPLGPVLREYILSEAMAALGVPTTRALAAVATGEPVVRERPEPGAVLARVASSHIRVGTFQYFTVRRDAEAVAALADHVIARHYPDADGPLGLLDAVVGAQARLVARWMSLGFVHGVMNTDNTSVAGETIDYGPCAFLDTYHPDRVFSSIDRGGRYAYAAQPQILMWNLAQLATSLLPAVALDRDAAIEGAQGVIDSYPERYQAAWLAEFRAKLGLETAEEGDADLISGLLDRMAEGQGDFTLTFRNLPTGNVADALVDRSALDDWLPLWRERLSREGATPEDRAAAMARVNPRLIPRNHRVAEAIAAAEDGDLAPFHRLTEALADPYGDDAATAELAAPPLPDEVVHATFCGT